MHWQRRPGQHWKRNQHINDCGRSHSEPNQEHQYDYPQRIFRPALHPRRIFAAVVSFHNGGIGKRDRRHGNGERPTYSVGESNTVFLMIMPSFRQVPCFRHKNSHERSTARTLASFVLTT